MGIKTELKMYYAVLDALKEEPTMLKTKKKPGPPKGSGGRPKVENPKVPISLRVSVEEKAWLMQNKNAFYLWLKTRSQPAYTQDTPSRIPCAR